MLPLGVLLISITLPLPPQTLHFFSATFKEATRPSLCHSAGALIPGLQSPRQHRKFLAPPKNAENHLHVAIGFQTADGRTSGMRAFRRRLYRSPEEHLDTPTSRRGAFRSDYTGRLVSRLCKRKPALLPYVDVPMRSTTFATRLGDTRCFLMLIMYRAD